MIHVNIKCTLYGIAAALLIFLKQESDHIINLGSAAGIKVFAPGGDGLFRHRVCYSGDLRGTATGSWQQGAGDVDRAWCCRQRTQIFHNGTAQSTVLDFYKVAIPASAVARAIAYAIELPAEVHINEILLRPPAQEF